MQTMTLEGMQALDGGEWSWGGFWTGVACGGTAVGAVAAWISPEPISKMAAYGLTVGAISCIGAILAS